MDKISVVIPCYNEEKMVNNCYERVKWNLERIKGYDYEIIFINDGSKDKTLKVMEELAAIDSNLKVISFSRNFGHQCAVTAGIKKVTGDAVVILDADLQDPPELIPDMVELWKQGNDVVFGKRKKREGENFFKLFTAKVFYKVLSSVSDIDIPRDTGDFRLVDRKVIDTINSMSEHNKFLRGLFSWVGYNQAAFEYERKERIAGTTKYSLKKMKKLAYDGVFGFSVKPLKAIGTLGIVSILMSFLLVFLYIFGVLKFTLESMILIAMIPFFSGLILIAMWIISEYIARIYDETRNRPQYIIDKTINL